MTKTDIFNRALALIGHDRMIPEGNTTMTEYVRCNSEWDGARRAVLTAQDWNWLVEETALIDGAETPDENSERLEYMYDRPDDCIRLVAMLDWNHRRVDHRQAGGYIYSEVDSAKFRYLPDAEDPDDWPSCIVDAVVYELAARISLAMTASGKVVQAMKQLAMSYLADARRIDASEDRRGGTEGDKYALSRR